MPEMRKARHQLAVAFAPATGDLMSTCGCIVGIPMIARVFHQRVPILSYGMSRNVSVSMPVSQHARDMHCFICYILLYIELGHIVFSRSKGGEMQLLISTTSMTPIYEQIVDQIRALIKEGNLKAGEPLDSVRSLARTCRISALTVKKAYDVLEREGLVITVQGKGSFVAQISPNIVAEELNRQVEEQFAQAIAKAQRLGLTREEILELVVMLLEDASADSGGTAERTEGAS
ncbi:Transcriptional regulator, GntR family [Bifidobacterium animalis subsp. animalis IM386]|uniref:Transcriptional regulator, GntR family n=2 Tax=Bifidobacterium animalis TaxID=28025 RepID=A0AAV2W3P7_9BIFI|nr:Transcriptional regulator, GntR family [Bifidobacterium animalis subsp. animalis IM386]